MTEVERAIVRAFRAGQKKAVDDYATWRNGAQFVGALERPKALVFKEIDAESDEVVLRNALRMME